MKTINFDREITDNVLNCMHESVKLLKFHESDMGDHEIMLALNTIHVGLSYMRARQKQKVLTDGFLDKPEG